MTAESTWLPVAVGLVLLLRFLPAWRWPTFTSDAGFHLLMRREIRNNGFRVPCKLQPCLFDEHVTYPWLYHQLIAFLPEAWLCRLPALPSAIIDGLHAGLAYWGGCWLAGVLGHPEASVRAGLFSALIFGLNPALLAHGMGPRAYEVTPRPLGEFFLSVALLSVVRAASGGSWGWWGVAVLAGGLLLLSSKFAAQVLVFYVPLLALVPGFRAAFWTLPGAFLAALLMSGGRYWKALQGQRIFLRYYLQTMQFSYSFVADRNRWKEVREAWGALRRNGFFSREFLRALARLYTMNTYLLMLVRGAVFLVLGVMGLSAAHREAWQLARPPALWFLAWSCAWLPPFLLTSTKHLRFLGEAERYAEYAICPVSILVATGLALAPLSLPVLAVLAIYAVCTAVAVGQAWLVNARVSAKVSRDREALVAALNKLPPGSTLLGIPAMQVLAPVSFQLPHRYADITTDAPALIRMIEERFDGYPWPRPDWAMWRAAGVD
ncbi:MAG: hypothetical protein GX616_08210, partial [Planctomycetes bacterium]|nr:hypothetical protein [Planctomycetota bacterium]